MSVRTDILDDIMTLLQGIDGTGDYNFAVAAVRRTPLNPDNEQHFPYVYINENREVYDAGPIQSPAGFLTRRLGLAIMGYVNVPATAAESAGLLLADVELALLQGDHSLGGKAVDIILVSNEMIADEIRPDLSGFLLEVEIQYRARHNDPNSAS